MPAAVVGLALVGGGAITATTLGYVALGVTVGGMVTKNKTLLKIGGQLGLAAGVASIATSFMGAGASKAATTMGEVAKTAGDVANVASGAENLSSPTNDLTISNYPNAGNPYPDTPSQLKESGWGNAVDYGGPGHGSSSSVNLSPDPLDKYNDLEGEGITTGAGNSPDVKAGLLGANQGTDIGVTKELGLNQGSNTGKTGGFFDFLKNSDGTYDKRTITEIGKVAAGGLQGLNTTSVENAKLAEARRLTDIQRANAASVGKSNYGILRG